MIKRWNSSELHLVAETKKDKRTLSKVRAKVDKILRKKSRYDSDKDLEEVTMAEIDNLMKRKKAKRSDKVVGGRVITTIKLPGNAIRKFYSPIADSNRMYYDIF